MNIAILGSSSHIAKNLITRFAGYTDDHLMLFCRNDIPVKEFICSYAPDGNIQIIKGYKDFTSFHFDVIINCVGAGAPGVLGFDIRNWFDLTAEFDELALTYLEKCNPAAILITFSSGAVYGTRSTPPFVQSTHFSVPVNDVAVSDYYSIARIHSEARHRSRPELRIADLRIFSFFSRFIRTDSGYFMSDVLDAVANKKTLVTGKDDMIRDYIAPDDLFELIRHCISMKKINRSLDVCSAAPVGKFEILEAFKEKFNLKWRFDQINDSPNGNKSIYASNCTHLAEIGFFPGLKSLDGLIIETEKFLSDKE